MCPMKPTNDPLAVFQCPGQRGEEIESRVHGLHDVVRVRVVHAAWQAEHGRDQEPSLVRVAGEKRAVESR